MWLYSPPLVVLVLDLLGWDSGTVYVRYCVDWPWDIYLESPCHSLIMAASAGLRGNVGGANLCTIVSFFQFRAGQVCKSLEAL